MFKKSIFSLCLFLCSFSLNAMQMFEVKDGETIKIEMSADDLTRITVENGRLDKVWGAKGKLTIKPDKKKGQIFITPIDKKKAVSFFVSDTEGSTYSILALPRKIPSQTVMLKIKKKRKAVTNQRYKASDYSKQIKRLIKAMALNKAISGYEEEESSLLVPLWKETKIKLLKVYEGTKFNGYVYSIKNLTSEDIEFHESEFMSFGQNVKAVALSELRLASKKTTSLYVVRKVEEQ